MWRYTVFKASQITHKMTLPQRVCSGWQQRKYQSPVSPALCVCVCDPPIIRDYLRKPPVIKLPVSIRLTSLELEQSRICLSDNETTLNYKRNRYFASESLHREVFGVPVVTNIKLLGKLSLRLTNNVKWTPLWTHIKQHFIYHWTPFVMSVKHRDMGVRLIYSLILYYSCYIIYSYTIHLEFP